ncbi:MAG: TetR family transcriptional regulator [Planctomycetes bacterium]|nr:TetR family transcriptional regulator [Planctomycetota bacterium]
MEIPAARIDRALGAGKTARFDEKRSHLLDGAARVFAELGYKEASIRQVAKATRFSLAGLYHYVRSKDELLFAIQYHTFGALVETLEEILRTPAAAESHLKAMVASHVRYLVAHLPELKVCTTELDSLEGDYYRQVLVRRQRYFELTQRILHRLRAQNHGARVGPNLAALYLFGMLNWIVMWFDPERNDPEELAASLVELFLRGYRHTPSSPARVDEAGNTRG